MLRPLGGWEEVHRSPQGPAPHPLPSPIPQGRGESATPPPPPAPWAQPRPSDGGHAVPLSLDSLSSTPQPLRPARSCSTELRLHLPAQGGVHTGGGGVGGHSGVAAKAARPCPGSEVRPE